MRDEKIMVLGFTPDKNRFPMRMNIQDILLVLGIITVIIFIVSSKMGRKKIG